MFFSHFIFFHFIRKAMTYWWCNFLNRKSLLFMRFYLYYVYCSIINTLWFKFFHIIIIYFNSEYSAIKILKSWQVIFRTLFELSSQLIYCRIFSILSDVILNFFNERQLSVEGWEFLFLHEKNKCTMKILVFLFFQTIVSSQVQPGDSEKRHQIINSIYELFYDNVLNSLSTDENSFDRYKNNFVSFQDDLIKNRNSICDSDTIKFTDLSEKKTQISKWLNQNGTTSFIPELVNYFNESVIFFNF